MVMLHVPTEHLAAVYELAAAHGRDFSASAMGHTAAALAFLSLAGAFANAMWGTARAALVCVLCFGVNAMACVHLAAVYGLVGAHGWNFSTSAMGHTAAALALLSLAAALANAMWGTTRAVLVCQLCFGVNAMTCIWEFGIVNG